MSESPDAENSQPLSALRLGLHNGAINGNSGTKQRRSLDGRNRVGNSRGVAGRGLDELRVTPVHGHTGNFLLHAEIFIAFAAELAFAARPVNPRHAHPVADFK